MVWKGFRWRVGKREGVCTFDDPWLLQPLSFKPVLAHHDTIQWVSDLILALSL